MLFLTFIAGIFFSLVIILFKALKARCCPLMQKQGKCNLMLKASHGLPMMHEKCNAHRDDVSFQPMSRVSTLNNST